VVASGVWELLYRRSAEELRVDGAFVNLREV